VIKVVVFDFDDTLIRSEEIKREGFMEIFSVVPGGRHAAADVFSTHPGLCRRPMIARILQVLFPEYQGLRLERTIDTYLEGYAVYTNERILMAPLLPGALEALEGLARSCRLYVNSNTPHDALELLVHEKDLHRFFVGIFGSPPGSKPEHLSHILEHEGVPPRAVVVVGDGESDWEAANACGCHFVGIGVQALPFAPAAPVCQDLSQLPSFVRSLALAPSSGA
jgi:phosphoglycolate phosphatase